MKQLFTAGIIFFALTGCSAQKQDKMAINKDGNTLLWKVSGKQLKKPSFLFGTFHLLCKDDIHFSAALKQAIGMSDTIYMEMDMDDPSLMLSGMLYMNMKDSTKLEDIYTEAEYQKVKDYFSDSLHIPIAMFERAKPYFLVALLYPRMMDCKTPAGIEQALLAIAKEKEKEIKGLETMKFQASVFDSIPYEWQAKELLKNIDSFSVAKNEFDKMLRLYKNQQLDSIANMIKESEFGEDKYGDILLTQRNKNWVEQLKGIMKSQSVFVAVGAGHLVGNTGLIELLRKEGYKVEPLKNK